MENKKWYLVLALPLILIYSLIGIGLQHNPLETALILLLILKATAIWFFIEAKRARKMSLASKH